MNGYGAILGYDSANTNGTTLTAGTSNNPGTAVEFISAAAHTEAWAGFWLTLLDTSANASYSVDVVTGASLSTVSFQGLTVFGNSGAAIVAPSYIPLAIGAGVRVGLQTRCGTNSATIKAILVPTIASSSDTHPGFFIDQHR